MRKLALGLVVVGALVAATAVPALAQISVYIGPGPGYYYDHPYYPHYGHPYYRHGYYAYGPGYGYHPGWYRHNYRHHWEHEGHQGDED